jgi:biotin-(acetyl-CoA carboxylase) ligase
MLVALTTVKEVAAVPPKLTAVAPVKSVPVMVTVSPVPADDGVNELIVGVGINVILPEELAVPPGVVTDIIPVVPLAITAVMLVALTTVKEVAGVPPKLTAVAPVKSVPIMVTVAPLAADDGVNELMLGAGINVKLPEELAIPPAVVTDIIPVVPLETTAVMLVALTTVKEVAAVPPKLTAVAPVKSVPIMVTVSPAPADDGVNELIVGAGINVKLLEELAVLPGVVTDIVPLVPVATTAVMLVALTTVKELAGVPPKLTAVAPVKTTPLIVTV